MCAKNGFVSNVFVKEHFLSYFLYVFAYYAYGKLYTRELPYSVTYRCTLNCEKCNHFTPVNKNAVHVPKEQIYQELDEYFSYVDFVTIGSFVGGELFLHPDLYDILEYALANYRNRYIVCQIITNGTIVPSDEILALCEKNNVKIILSDYRLSVPEISKKVEMFIDKIRQSKLELEIAENMIWTDYAIGSAENGFNDKEDIAKHFDRCNYPCRYLRDGKLYFCTSDYMAQYLKIVPKDPQSYFDLRKKASDADRKKALLEFSLGFVNERGYLLSCEKCYGGWTISPVKVPAAIQLRRSEH